MIASFKYSPPVRGKERKREPKAFTFQGNDGDHILRAMVRTRTFYETDLLEAVYQQLSGASGIAIDVGANIGSHSVYLAGVAGMNVLAVEPAEDALYHLKGNIEGNGLDSRIQVAPVGISDAPGFARGHQAVENNTGSHTLTRVTGDDIDGALPLITLTDAWTRFTDRAPVAFLKVDVEGMEFEVLSGGMRLITAHNPMIAIEVKKGERKGRAVQLLRALGYSHVGAYCITPVWLFKHGRR